MIKVYLMSHLNDYMNYYQSLNGLTKPIISKYTNEKSKMESISTEVLLNYAFYDVYKHQFSFPIQTTNTGKPVLLNETGIHFNKSHSMNYGLVVLSNEDVGCDIEYINQQFKLIPNVLTISELKMYEDAKVHQSELFFKFWTAKEAYLKLLGIGITKKISNFQYEPLGLNEGKIDNVYIYHFTVDEHMIAIATKTKQEIEISYVKNEEIQSFLKAIQE